MRSRRSRTASVTAVVRLSPVSSLSYLVRWYASLFLMFMLMDIYRSTNRLYTYTFPESTFYIIL